MQLDFIDNINAFDESMIRLYDFDRSEAILFKELIEEVIIKNNKKVNLASVDFIEPRNCNMLMGIGKEDDGILTQDQKIFYCILRIETYEKMLELIQPFCEKETKAHQYLYDIDNPIDFLFAPAGSW